MATRRREVVGKNVDKIRSDPIQCDIGLSLANSTERSHHPFLLSLSFRLIFVVSFYVDKRAKEEEGETEGKVVNRTKSLSGVLRDAWWLKADRVSRYVCSLSTTFHNCRAYLCLGQPKFGTSEEDMKRYTMMKQKIKDIYSLKRVLS